MKGHRKATEVAKAGEYGIWSILQQSVTLKISTKDTDKYGQQACLHMIWYRKTTAK